MTVETLSTQINKTENSTFCNEVFKKSNLQIKINEKIFFSDLQKIYSIFHKR